MFSLVVLFLAIASQTSAEHHLAKVGDIRTLAHGVGGKVYAKDEKTLVVKDFTYDGAGPDAFFWVGKEGSPSTVGTILPYPFEGKFFDYEDPEAPILTGKFDGTKEIVLTLPDDLKVTDLKWLSVWCRAFKINFGDVTFADDFSLEAHHDVDPLTEDDAKAEDLPPPLVSNNVHNADRHDGDADAEAEAEAESEAESEPEGAYAEGESEPENSATTTGISFGLYFFVAVVTRQLML